MLTDAVGKAAWWIIPNRHACNEESSYSLTRFVPLSRSRDSDAINISEHPAIAVFDFKP